MDEGINNIWEEMTGTIKIISEEVLGKSRVRIVDKDT